MQSCPHRGCSRSPFWLRETRQRRRVGCTADHGPSLWPHLGPLGHRKESLGEERRELVRLGLRLSETLSARGRVRVHFWPNFFSSAESRWDPLVVEMHGYGAFGGAKKRAPPAEAPLSHGGDLGSDSLAGLRGAPLLFQPTPSSAGPARTVVRSPQGAPRAHRKKGSGAGWGPQVTLLRTHGPGPALAPHLVGFLFPSA